MFRRVLVLISLLLFACAPNLETQVTIMPELPHVFEASLRKECQWIDMVFPMNDEHSETLKFNVQDCPRRKNPPVVTIAGQEFPRNPLSPLTYEFVETEYGGYLYTYRKSYGRKHNIRIGIANRGHLTKKEFIDMYLEMHGVSENCEALKQSSYAYRIIRSDFRTYIGFDILEDEPWNEFMARYTMYRNINGKRNIPSCMELSNLIFTDNIVFLLPPNDRAHIDFQSVSYERKH